MVGIKHIILGLSTLTGITLLAKKAKAAPSIESCGPEFMGQTRSKQCKDGVITQTCTMREGAHVWWPICPETYELTVTVTEG